MIDDIYKLFPLIVGLLGIGASFYTLQKTIKHQRDIKSAEIKKEIKTKNLNDFIDAFCELERLFSDLHYNIPENYDTAEIISIKKTALINLSGQIKYMITKIKMLLSNTTETNKDIIIRLIMIYLKIVQLASVNDDVKRSDKEIMELLGILSNNCQVYVEKERLEIENLISEKNNIVLAWFKKAWKEIEEYN